MIQVDTIVNLCQTYINSISNRVEPSDWYTFITSAIREIRRGRTFPSQRRQSSIDVFSGVFVYPLASDFSSFIKPHDSLFEQSDQGPYMVYGRDKDFFANNKYGLAITANAGTKFLMIRRDGKANMNLDSFEDSDTSAYIAGGDASGLLINTYDAIEGNASLQFNITDVTNESTITKTLPETTDISDFIDFGGTAFLSLKATSILPSVKLRLISSTGNYYESALATQQYQGVAFDTDNWNILGMSLKNATVVGAPDKTAITSYQIVIDNTAVSVNGVLIDALYLRLPQKMELPYNSKYVVTDDLGVPKEAVTIGSDYVLIDEDYVEMIAYKSVEHGAKWKFGDAEVEKMAASEYNEAYKEFSRRYPSTEAPIQSSYYKDNRF